MSVSTAVPLWMARKAAEQAVELLGPVCERIMIAGSVRREQDVVHDIDIVATPRIDAGEKPRPGQLFAGPVNLLHELCDRIAAGKVEQLRRPTAPEGFRTPAWGDRRRVLATQYHPGRWMPLELWMVPKGSWGPLLTIRTGPGDFSKRLVTSVDYGGAMPRGMRMHEGRLEYLADRSKPVDDPEAWQAMHVTEEPEFFDTLKLRFIEPKQRSDRQLRLALGGLL